MQTADPDRQGATRADVDLGLNLAWKGGHRLGLELALPVYQDLDGPQLESEWRATVGYQYAF